MPPRVSSRIEPLSARRYKVQLRAGAALARKLELARDLMRHCHPGGELELVVERAMDLLIERLMHHNRFAAEQEYGRSHIEHFVAERRRKRRAQGPAI